LIHLAITFKENHSKIGELNSWKKASYSFTQVLNIYRLLNKAMANYHIQIIESNRKQIRNYYTKFVLAPLRRSQGITIGNTVQKILLLSTRGTAITSVQIAELRHLFDSVNGVREDGLELILNLKQLVFRGYLSEVAYGNLLVTGPATVTASNLELPSEITIVDPDQYIATLLPGSQLDIKFTLETGKGYRSIEPNFNELLDTQFLLVDSIFSPILKVDYSVETIQSVDSFNLESLILEIWTNGSISPNEALTQAGKIAVRLFSEIANPESLENLESLDDSNLQADQSTELNSNPLGLNPSSNPSQTKINLSSFSELDWIDTMSEEVKKQIQDLDERTTKIVNLLQTEIKSLKEKEINNSSKVQQLEKEKYQLQSQLKAVEDNFRKADNNQSKLSSEVENLRQENSKFKSDLSVEKNNINGLEEQCFQLEFDLENSQNQNQKIEQEKSKLQSDVNSLRNEKSVLENWLSETQNQFEKVNNRNLENTNQLQKLSEENSKIKTFLIEIKEELKQANQEKNKLSSQVNALGENLSQLKSNLTSAQEELQKVNSDKNNLSSEINTLKNERNQLQNKTEQLEAKIQDIENKLVEVTKEKEELLNLSRQTTQERLKLHEERLQLQNELNQIKRDQMALQSQFLERSNLLKEANSQLEILAQQLYPSFQLINQKLDEGFSNTFSPEIQVILSELKLQLFQTQEKLHQIQPIAIPLLDSLRQEQDSLKSQLSTTQSQMAQVSQERAELQSQIRNMLTQLEQTQQDLQQSRQEYLQLQNQLSELNRQLVSNRQDLERKEAELSTSHQQVFQQQDQLANTGTQLKQSQDEQILLREQLSNSETQLKKITTELEKTQQLITQTQSNFQQLQQQKLELENHLANNQGRLEQSLQQLNQSQDHQLNLRDQLSTADRRVKELEQELADLQQKIDPSKSSIDWLNPFKKK
jgi:DNA-directed RNA polymerase subunit alpha